ncbi:MAG: hypothetical protein J6T84_09105 [Spirochaetaceae bacterium]|nr:hypothetical protein [Spirochaetaceae bacterium]
MENKELQDKIEDLKKKKQGYDRNRTICVFVIAIIIYYIYQSYKTDTMQLWFLLIMGLIILASVLILIYDCFQVKSISNELNPLEQEFVKTLEADEPESTDNDDAEDEV